jgi:hypothetical protein
LVFGSSCGERVVATVMLTTKNVYVFIVRNTQ